MIIELLITVVNRGKLGPQVAGEHQEQCPVAKRGDAKGVEHRLVEC
jgi:hypothetical protein